MTWQQQTPVHGRQIRIIPHHACDRIERVPTRREYLIRSILLLLEEQRLVREGWGQLGAINRRMLVS